jgi:hypothetical protein
MSSLPRKPQQITYKDIPSIVKRLSENMTKTINQIGTSRSRTGDLAVRSTYQEL